MLGRGAATSADELHAELVHAARVDAEVLGGRHVDEALVDAARKACVGERPHGEAGREHRLRGLEHVHRAVAAVDADDARAPLLHEATDFGGGRAVGHAAVLVDRSRADDRDLRAARGDGALDRDAQLVRLAKRLDHDAVDAARDERLHLLGDRDAHLLEVDGQSFAEEVARRTDRTDHERLGARGITRELHGGVIDLGHLRGKAVLLEAHGVGAERVGLDHGRAGAHVILVDLADELGLRDVELFEANAEEHASLVELRPHRAVDHERTARERFEKSGHGERS